MSTLRPGEARALVRPLQTDVDPASLYAALCEDGAREDTMLFERKGGPSLLLDRAAVRVECRGPEVVVVSLGEGAANLLERLKERFPDRLLEVQSDRLRLLFPRPVGLDPRKRLLAPSPMDMLRALVSAFVVRTPEEPFTLAATGVVAFDHVDLLEELPPSTEDPIGFPDFIFWLAESLVVIEPTGRARAITTAFGGASPSDYAASQRLSELIDRCEKAKPIPLASQVAAEPNFASADLDDAAYERAVLAMKREIAAGEVYQIVPSRTFRAPCADPLAAFTALRRRDPSPYHFYVRGPEHLLFGASPETSVRVSQGEVEVKPIAGTRPRGRTEDEDDRLEADLRLDGKELAEHMMLVDLARNDVAQVSRPGTRRVAKLMTVERYARVMHLVSSVTGELADGLDAVHALQACLNVGTLTGAPKLRATQLLREVERFKRGPYGGAVGWLNSGGMMDTAVVIRSAVVKNGTAYVRAGAGVVHDSVPAAEAEETKRKASALLSVLGGLE